MICTAASLFFRDAIASFAANRVLAARGFECDGVSVQVPLRLPPSPVVLEPTRCDVKKGPLESIEFKTPVRVVLKGMKIELIRVASLAIDLRVRGQPDVDLNGLGDITKLLGADHPAIELMIDTALLSKDKNPPVLVEDARITRGGVPVTEMHQLRVISTEEGMVVTSPRANISQAAQLGEGSVRVEATSTTARVDVVFLSKLKVKLLVDHIGAARLTAAFQIGLDGTQLAPAADAARDDKKVEQGKADAKPVDMKAVKAEDINRESQKQAAQ